VNHLAYILGNTSAVSKLSFKVILQGPCLMKHKEKFWGSVFLMKIDGKPCLASEGEKLWPDG